MPTNHNTQVLINNGMHHPVQTGETNKNLRSSRLLYLLGRPALDNYPSISSDIELLGLDSRNSAFAICRCQVCLPFQSHVLQWLADRALKGEKAHQIDLADQLKPIAQDLGCSLAQLSLAWLLKNPHVSSVITGSTKVPQVRACEGKR